MYSSIIPFSKSFFKSLDKAKESLAFKPSPELSCGDSHLSQMIGLNQIDPNKFLTLP